MKKSVFWMAAAVVMAACSSDDEWLDGGADSGADEARKVTVIATLPGADTRVTLQDVTDENGKNIIKVDWNESGEAFTAMTTAAVGRDDEQTYVFSQTAGEEFTGTLPAAVDGAPYYAFYPAVDLWTEDSDGDGGDYNYVNPETWEDVTTFSASGVPFDLSEQYGTLDEARTLMYATSGDGGKFAFKHLTAIVKFTLTGLPENVGNAYFGLIWENGCSTSGVLDLTRPSVEAMYPMAEQVVVAIMAAPDDGSCTFYAYLPPLAQGTTLHIMGQSEDADNYYTYTKDVVLPKAVEAGKFYRMAREVDVETQSRHMTAGTVEELKAWLETGADGISLTLTADIDLTGVDLDLEDDESNWPYLELFSATFDGGGHTLTGLKRYHNDEYSENEAAAMFAYVAEDATVKNLHLADVDFKSPRYMAAGIVADNLGTVEGCSVSGTVVSEGERSAAGGVVALNCGTVRGCYSTASVTGCYQACGVVGENQGSVAACYSTGTLTGSEVYGVAYSISPSGVTACYWNCAGATYGLGYTEGGILTSTNDNATPVDGTTVTWETAMSAMNTALGTGFGWQYVANTDEATKGKEPLKLQAVAAE